MRCLMAVNDVVGVLKLAVAQKYDGRNLSVSVESDCQLEDESGRVTQAIMLSVVNLDQDPDSPVMQIVIPMESQYLVFDSESDKGGTLIYDSDGNPTAKPTDMVAMKIALRFMELIGNQYFFKGK